jgi:hypothetical protein
MRPNACWDYCCNKNGHFVTLSCLLRMITASPVLPLIHMKNDSKKSKNEFRVVFLMMLLIFFKSALLKRGAFCQKNLFLFGSSHFIKKVTNP